MTDFILNKVFLLRLIILWQIAGLNDCYIASKIYNPKNKYNLVK